MSKVIRDSHSFYTHGWQGDVDIAEGLSEYGIFDSGDFIFDEAIEVNKPNAFFRVYHTKDKTTLEEAMEGFVKRICGAIEAEGESYGYSEVTIEGFSVRELKIGGHEIQKIINGFPGEYLHVLIDILPNAVVSGS